MVSATEIERATRVSTAGNPGGFGGAFFGSINGFDWSIRENKAGRCEVRVQHGGPGPENCTTIAKKAMWVYVPQIIADHINNVLETENKNGKQRQA